MVTINLNCSVQCSILLAPTVVSEVNLQCNRSLEYLQISLVSYYEEFRGSSSRLVGSIISQLDSPVLQELSIIQCPLNGWDNSWLEVDAKIVELPLPALHSLVVVTVEKASIVQKVFPLCHGSGLLSVIYDDPAV